MDKKILDGIEEVKSFMSKQMEEDKDEHLLRENYISVVADDGQWLELENHACTAGLSNHQMREWAQGGNKPNVIVSALTHGSKRATPLQRTEIGLAFIDWLINRSPYSIAFISKDAQEVVDSGFLICTADVPANILVGGLIASRTLWEYTSVSKAWYELASRGCNENLAFIFAHKAEYSGGVVSFGCNNDGHKAIFSSVGMKYIKNFVNNTPARTNADYGVKIGYESISQTWGEGYNGDKIVAICNKVVDSAKLGNNPFHKALSQDEQNACTVEGGFNQLAVLVKELENKL